MSDNPIAETTLIETAALCRESDDLGKKEVSGYTLSDVNRVITPEIRVETIYQRPTYLVIGKRRPYHGLAILRLGVDITDYGQPTPFKKGALVLARWRCGTESGTNGWKIIGTGFYYTLNESDVEVVERHG